jgi:hypothetical protein
VTWEPWSVTPVLRIATLAERRDALGRIEAVRLELLGHRFGEEGRGSVAV